MKKIMAVYLLLVFAVSLFGCGGTGKPSETEAATEPVNAQYGLLQPLVEDYGFPFALRCTEGMELTNFNIHEHSAQREWHTNNDNTTQDGLTWNLTDDTLEISGEWTESFTLDMERGTATSLTDGMEYRMVVHLPDSIDTKWYVPWPTDEGFTEIDGIRYESNEAFGVVNALSMCQFVKDCMAEPNRFQIHGISHIEKDGYHYYYLDFSQEVKNGEMERTYFYGEFYGSTLLWIVNENSAIYYQTEGDYEAKYPALAALFREESSELLDVADIAANIK